MTSEDLSKHQEIVFPSSQLRTVAFRLRLTDVNIAGYRRSSELRAGHAPYPFRYDSNRGPCTTGTLISCLSAMVSSSATVGGDSREK